MRLTHLPRFCMTALLAFGLAACDDDSDAADAGMDPQPDAEPAPQPDAEPAPQPDAEPAPQPDAEPAPQPDAEPAPDPTFALVVTGPLFTDDLDEAQALHDQLAAGGEEAATAAGDFGHEAMLGTTLLGSPENQFFGMDRWTDAQAMGEFYANPDFQAAFGMLFGGPPALTTWVHRPDWYSWGDLDIIDDAEEYWFVVVQGELADDADAVKPMHDQVAAGGEEAVTAAGDVAHVVYLGLEDPNAFLAIDIWTDATTLEAVYSDPDFQAAFGSLFAAPPSIVVYRSTEWHQW